MIRYPAYRQELLKLLRQDQFEIRKAASGQQLVAEFARSADQRMRRVNEILATITYPTVVNVGADGSQAISVIALHSKLSDMEQVLARFCASFDMDPKSVYFEAIPSLTDRVRVLQGKKQLFGTQWFLGNDSIFHLFPVENFKEMNTRRATHGLEKSRHAMSLLSTKTAEAKVERPFTCEADQREPSKEEYEAFIEGQTN